MNLLKGGLVYADILNTVSPTYAREIQTAEFGYGLEGVLQARKDRLFGVTNGIDYNVWNPETDPHLPARYSVDDDLSRALAFAPTDDLFSSADLSRLRQIASSP